MRILFLGDIVGSCGRKAVVRSVPRLRRDLQLDVVLPRRVTRAELFREVRVSRRAPEQSIALVREGDARFRVDVSGDEGARRLLAENEPALVKVPIGDPGVIRDIDRPADLSPPIVV